MSRETDGYDFVQFIFFRTSARPFPAGGFPPKVLQGNAGHLGDCFSAEKYRCRDYFFSSITPTLCKHSSPLCY